MLGKNGSSLPFVSLRLTEHVSQYCRLKSLKSREDKLAEWTAIYNLTLCSVVIVLYSVSIEKNLQGNSFS